MDEDDIVVIVEPRNEYRDLAAALVFLRILGCGIFKSIRMARATGFASSSYILQKYRTFLYLYKMIDFAGNSICIGPRGREIVDDCDGDVDCVADRLRSIYEETRRHK